MISLINLLGRDILENYEIIWNSSVPIGSSVSSIRLNEYWLNNDKRIIILNRIPKTLMVDFFNIFIPTIVINGFYPIKKINMVTETGWVIMKPGYGARTVGIIVLHKKHFYKILTSDFRYNIDKFSFFVELFEKYPDEVKLYGFSPDNNKYKNFINNEFDNLNYIAQPYIQRENIKFEIRVYANFRNEIYPEIVLRPPDYLNIRGNGSENDGKMVKNIKKFFNKTIRERILSVIREFNNSLKIKGSIYPVFSLDLLITLDDKVIPIDYGIEFAYKTIMEKGNILEFAKFVNKSFNYFLQ